LVWDINNCFFDSKTGDKMMKRYRKIPVEVEAMQWDGMMETWDKFVELLGNAIDWKHTEVDPDTFYIDTLEGTMAVEVGDYVIKEPFPTDDRKFYPCKKEIFEKTYEPILPVDFSMVTNAGYE